MDPETSSGWRRGGTLDSPTRHPGLRAGIPLRYGPAAKKEAGPRIKSGATGGDERVAQGRKWTLKQVQGDDWGSCSEPQLSSPPPPV